MYEQIQAELFQILEGDAVKMLHSICQANLEKSAVTTGLEKVSFHSNPKERQSHQKKKKKERQSQRMFKLLYNRANFTY